MPTPLNPIGQNGPLSVDILTTSVETQLIQLSSTRDHAESEPFDHLFPQAVLTLSRLGDDARARRVLALAPDGAHPLLWTRVAEGVVPRDGGQARVILEQEVPSCLDGAVLGGVGRVLFLLGDEAAAGDWFARARQAAASVQDWERLLGDHLAVGDGVGALAVLRLSGQVSRPLRVKLLRQLHGAGQLSAGLMLLHPAGDVLDRYALIREVMAAPLEARDEAGCLQLLHAAPQVYWEDLLRVLVTGFLDAQMLAAAARAAALWRTVDAVGISSLGALALVGEPEEARRGLAEKLAEHLAQEEGMFSDIGVYRELGRACGWAGDMAGALAALERVADHEDRLQALLDAAVYAPIGVREALLCAARGLVASLEGERSRAWAAGQLGETLARLGRREQARTLFADASQVAAAIRLPRADLGMTRRTALESLIRAQIAAGEHPGAYQTARKLRTRHHRNAVLRPSVLAYARAGDLAGAHLCLELMAPAPSRLATTTAALQVWLEAGRPVLSRREPHAA